MSEHPQPGWPYQPGTPPQYPYPYPGHPGAPVPGAPVPVAPQPPVPPGLVSRRPLRVEPVPGTGFGVAYPEVAPTVAGMAIGSMIGGIGSILVATLVFCFGAAGASATWGALVAGAFAVLAGLVGAAATATGLVVLRQIRRASGALSGRGMAIAGVSCGATGFGLTVLGFLVAILLS